MQWMEKAQTTTNKLQGYVSASGQPQVAWRTAVRVSYRRFTDKEDEWKDNGLHLSVLHGWWLQRCVDLRLRGCENKRKRFRLMCSHDNLEESLLFCCPIRRHQSQVFCNLSYQSYPFKCDIHCEQAYFIPKHVFLNLTECFSCWNLPDTDRKQKKKQRVDSVIIGPKQDVITCLLM